MTWVIPPKNIEEELKQVNVKIAPSPKDDKVFKLAVYYVSSTIIFYKEVSIIFDFKV